MANNTTQQLDKVIATIRANLTEMQFGSLQIIVQNGKVVQIDRTDKRRITNE